MFGMASKIWKPPDPPLILASIIHNDLGPACFPGVGIFPRQENLSVADEANRLAAQSDLDYVEKFIAGCSLNFQPHARVLVSD
ncbi:MAG: hypothetical protein Ct9H300mP22_6570 [Gammaproteobacteria bacterium]|nr:MAG: hypothetical protein Ct9H300mP22_6570 [Gammaproteobacteria bacterium]